METGQAGAVSVIGPIGRSVGRVKGILFSPFEMAKWFAIGFCAWISEMGFFGGFNFRPFGRVCKQSTIPQQVGGFIQSNMALSIGIGAVSLLVVSAIAIVLVWVSSRGRFMFLDCVVKNKGEVSIPWREYKKEGNSLFLFRVLVGFIGFWLIAFAATGAGFSAVIIRRGDFTAGWVAVLAAMAVLVMVMAVIMAGLLLVLKFTKDFVVPIMYMRRKRVRESWREFLGLLGGHKAEFVLYILFQLVIGIAISVIVVWAILLTCCCAGVILAIPYIGTVAMLPVLVFLRSYSLYYLRQFGAGFDSYLTAASE